MIKRLYRSTMASQRQSLYLFGSLEVHRTAYSGTTYTIDDKTLVPYLMSNGVRLARLHYESAVTVPQVAGTGLTDALGKTNTAATLHVLLELGDHLGSTGTVLDKVSSELVERTGYLPFGARENDYRPSRWNGFREDYGFTGKEEDVQVGLVYFGKRYLSPQLGRWLSADPLATHAPGRADFNLYAYVSGAVLKNVDPVGLCADDGSSGCTGNQAQTPGPATGSEGTTGNGDSDSSARLDATNGYEAPTVHQFLSTSAERERDNASPAPGGGGSSAPHQLSSVGGTTAMHPISQGSQLALPTDGTSGGTSPGNSAGVSMMPNVPVGQEPQLDMGSGFESPVQPAGMTFYAGYTASGNRNEAILATTPSQNDPGRSGGTTGLGLSQGLYFTSDGGFGFYVRQDKLTAYGNAYSTGLELGVSKNFSTFNGSSRGYYADLNPSKLAVANASVTIGDGQITGGSVVAPFTGISGGNSYGSINSSTITFSLSGLLIAPP